MKRLPVILAFVVGLAACGGNSPAPTSSVSSSAQSAALSYQATGADMSAVIDQYRTGATSIQDVNSCQTVEAAYQATMGPIIDRMAAASGPMDQYMSSALGSASADMTCVAAAMKAEFARHVAVACAVADATANRTEALQHATTMGGWADHERVRYEQMGYALGMMAATADTTWACVHNADGSFTLNGNTWMVPVGSSTPTTPPPTPTTTTGATSWPMPCGGMMSQCNVYGYPTPTPTPTLDPVAFGQRIFMSGTGVDGQPLARTGGYGMMMVSGCASCHGVDGHGLRTMMFTTPNITYANLTDPAGMLDPDGTRGPTYTDDLIRRAVTQGSDAAGDALSTAMPRWQLGDEDWNDLLAFLKTLR